MLANAEIEGTPKTILEPTPGKGNLLDILQGKFPNAIIYFPENDFMNMDVVSVDWVIANPPFTPMQKGYDILDRLFEFSNNVIALMPWLTITNSEKRTKRLVEKGLCKIIHLPRKAFPGSRVQTCILKFKHNFNETITFEAPAKP